MHAFTRRDAAAESDRITSSAGDVIDEHRPSIVLFFSPWSSLAQILARSHLLVEPNAFRPVDGLRMQVEWKEKNEEKVSNKERMDDLKSPFSLRLYKPATVG